MELGTQAWLTESPAVRTTVQPLATAITATGLLLIGAPDARGCTLPGILQDAHAGSYRLNLVRTLPCCPSGHSSEGWSSDPNLNAGIVCANSWDLRGETFHIKENIPVIGSPWNLQRSHFQMHSKERISLQERPGKSPAENTLQILWKKDVKSSEVEWSLAVLWQHLGLARQRPTAPPRWDPHRCSGSRVLDPRAVSVNSHSRTFVGGFHKRSWAPPTWKQTLKHVCLGMCRVSLNESISKTISRTN